MANTHEYIKKIYIGDTLETRCLVFRDRKSAMSFLGVSGHDTLEHADKSGSLVKKRYRVSIERWSKAFEYFFDEWSPEMAYCLGILVSDGNLKEHGGRGRTPFVRFASSDKDVIELVKSYIGGYQKIGEWHEKGVQRKTMYTLEYGSRHMYDTLCRMGLGPRKTYYDFSLDIPEEYRRYFWLGFIDGDGCVTRKVVRGNRKCNQLSIEAVFSEANPTLLHQYEEFLTSIGVTFNTFYRDIELTRRNSNFSNVTMGTYQVTCSGNRNARKLATYLWRDGEKSMERKRKRVISDVNSWH